MIRSVALALCAVAPLVAATPAAAQFPDLPISLEVRAGLLAPAGDWAVTDRETSLRAQAGPVFAGVLRVDVSGGLSAYGTYEYGLPGCDDCGLFGLDDRLVDSGFGFGIGYTLPLLLPVAIRLDLGGITHQLAFRGGGETRTSERGLGLETGVTGSWEFRPSLSLEPAVSMRSYNARYEFEDEDFREVEVRYFAPRIGLRYRF